MTELEVMLIYNYLVFSCPLFFQEIWCTDSKKIDIHEHGKKNFHSFYAFELMKHFLGEEGFFNMHSDILLNVTLGI